MTAIERRPLVHPPGEVARLRDLSESINNVRASRFKTVIGLNTARDHAELLARQTVRRELLALRRRIEGWAEDIVDAGASGRVDPVELLRDVVTVLDERFLHNGGIERGTE